MREPLRDQGRLRHILGAIDNVLEFMEEKTADDLRRDRILFYAVVKNIEIIGEAAYMLSDDFKTSHPGTEWKSIVAMRHFLVHGYYQVSEEAANQINDTKKSGGRVICVGTTSCRTIESAADEKGHLSESSGWTDIFIYPGYKFKVLDALITNFHLPESTLIMLVSALADKEKVLNAYSTAVKEKYRFFSFGDAMFITDEGN